MAMTLTQGHTRIRATQGLMTRIALQIGISLQAVSKWDRIPAERVLTVEKITGISRHELRPDLYPREADDDSTAGVAAIRPETAGT